MAKPEWGTKRICPACGARYYDMRKDPPTCPSCKTVFDPEQLLKSRRARPLPADDTKKPAAARGDGDETIGIETEEAGLDTPDEVEEVEGAEEDLEVADLETADEEIADEDADVLLEDADELVEDEEIEVGDVGTEEER